MSNKRVLAQIDLSAIEDNIKALYNHMPNPKPILAVVKADGYGHGASNIAKRLDTLSQIYGFATATAEEAIELRDNGISKPIMILGYVFAEDYKRLIQNGIIFTVFDEVSASNISKEALSLGIIAKVHIKVDTGMSRIGVKPNDEGFEIVKKIKSYSNLDVEGIYTHFARADEVDKSNAYKQLTTFNNFVARLSDAGINFDIVHCANSGAILQLPEAQLSIVRAGIVMYGLWPSSDTVNKDVPIRPALTLKSHVVHVKNIEEGTPVSYGGTYVANKSIRVATVPVGYADGYPRSLSSKGKVLVNGQYANIIGRICMDQMMIDVTDLNVNVLDEVVLIGTSNGKSITAEELGDMSGRFNYELVCDISPRVPREYIN